MKYYCLLLIIGFIVILSGCQSGNQVNALDMEVVEQTDTVCGKGENNQYLCDVEELPSSCLTAKNQIIHI